VEVFDAGWFLGLGVHIELIGIDPSRPAQHLVGFDAVRRDNQRLQRRTHLPRPTPKKRTFSGDATISANTVASAAGVPAASCVLLYLQRFV
jgi:hypothetical protein